MHRPHSITWTTHTEESTTVLEATRLQEALLYTALHYTYMCNIVTEFYLYSIVYVYLINSRLDVTSSVRHHFCTTRTLSWCQISGKNSRNKRENLTVIELTCNNNNAGKFKEEFIAFQEAF